MLVPIPVADERKREARKEEEKDVKIEGAKNRRKGHRWKKNVKTQAHLKHTNEHRQIPVKRQKKP